MAEGVAVDVHEGLRIALPPGVDADRAVLSSATQYETFDLCKRKWWFQWGVKLEKLEQDFLTFGTTLHAACERYLLADNLGRDATGRPVDLWPVGWNTNIPPAQADLIKRLVAEGIKSGLLVRRPGRLVEHAFLAPLGEHRGMLMFGTGKIDMMVVDGEEPEVQDHKTTKAMRWAKSPKALAQTTQMLTYAGEVQRQRAARGLPMADKIKVRHNVYVKDPAAPAVKIVEAWVTASAVEARLEQNRAAATQMVNFKTAFLQPEDWHRLPEPASQGRACSAYGGCPYLMICGGRETPTEYSKRIERVLGHKAQQDTNARKDHAMSAVMGEKLAAAKSKKAAAKINGDVPAAGPADDTKFWILNDKRAVVEATGASIREALAAGTMTLGSSAMLQTSKTWSTVGGCGFVEPVAAPPPPVEAAPPPPPSGEGDVVDEEAAPAAPPTAPPPAQAPFAVSGTPPWAAPNCTACAAGPHPGFTTKGNPCRICDDIQSKAKGPTSAGFALTTENGVISWTAKDGTQGSAPIPGTTPVVAKKAAKAAPTAAEPVRKGPGRPKVTFRLYINCMPLGQDAIDAAEILRSYGAKVAEVSGAASYYDLDAFKRRDSLVACAEEIVAEVEGKRVVVSGAASPDLRALVDVLRGYASEVVVGSSA